MKNNLLLSILLPLLAIQASAQIVPSTPIYIPSSSFRLHWVEPVSDNIETNTVYMVERKLSNTYWVQVATTMNTFYEERTLPEGTYRYRITKCGLSCGEAITSPQFRIAIRPRRSFALVDFSGEEAPIGQGAVFYYASSNGPPQSEPFPCADFPFCNRFQ